MAESVQSLIATSPWAMMAVAFLFGMGFGWLFGSGGRTEARARADAENRVAVVTADPADDPKEIVVIRAELEAAKALLDDGDDQDEVRKQLASLDDAVNRANGRLKTLIKAIKKNRSL